MRENVLVISSAEKSHRQNEYWKYENFPDKNALNT